MKKTICALILASLGSIMMVFAAAKADPCTEKHNQCSDACSNVQTHCKLSGSDPDNCERAYRICLQKCDKEKKDCEGKGKKG